MVKRIKHVTSNKSEVLIPDPPVILAVDGNSLSSCSLPHLTSWDLVPFGTAFMIHGQGSWFSHRVADLAAVWHAHGKTHLRNGTNSYERVAI